MDPENIPSPLFVPSSEIENRLSRFQDLMISGRAGWGLALPERRSFLFFRNHATGLSLYSGPGGTGFPGQEKFRTGHGRILSDEYRGLILFQGDPFFIDRKGYFTSPKPGSGNGCASGR